MPYALFCHEAKLSKTYPTEADVWRLARQSGLVVDAASDEGQISSIAGRTMSKSSFCNSTTVGLVGTTPRGLTVKGLAGHFCARK